MLVIPLQAVPNQILTVPLAGQAAKIAVYQKTTGLYVDLYVNDVLIIGGVLGLNAVRIVRDTYLGFIGDLAFSDTQGTNDPDYTGLGGRYQFVYLEVADLS